MVVYRVYYYNSINNDSLFVQTTQNHTPYIPTVDTLVEYHGLFYRVQRVIYLAETNSWRIDTIKVKP